MGQGGAPAFTLLFRDGEGESNGKDRGMELEICGVWGGGGFFSWGLSVLFSSYFLDGERPRGRA